MVRGLSISTSILVFGASMVNKLLEVVAKISKSKFAVQSSQQAIAMPQDTRGQTFMITITRTVLVTGKQDLI